MATDLYIVRHGRTMFNTLHRAQGWSDTPLTSQGQEGIRELGVGLRERGISFHRALSSDLGRTIMTMDILLTELGLKGEIPYTYDARIREWSFGSNDGVYDDELFFTILPRIAGVDSLEEMTYEDMANAIYEADTADWAETWEQLRGRLLAGIEDLAKKMEAAGGGNALVVCHGMSIGTLLYLLNGQRFVVLDNGSVTRLRYENGQFQVLEVGDLSYRQEGRSWLDQNQS
ncbi:histidine phosphatase family protein [Streptococcus sp. 10F2]